ncbi:GntR family transcriptional regulator [bacterium]|nr:GntR family transcriptional regulator [bacterium]
MDIHAGIALHIGGQPLRQQVFPDGQGGPEADGAPPQAQILHIPFQLLLVVEHAQRGIAQQLPLLGQREALALLEQDGLVQIRRGIGALVTPITFEDIEYIQEARILLEPKAVRYALTHITREDIDELRGMLHRLQARLSNGEKISPQEFFKADFDFHNLVIARCENPYIKRFLYTINSSVRRLQVLSFNRQYSLDSFIAQHLDLLDVIETKNPDAVEAAFKAHLDLSYDNIKR